MIYLQYIIYFYMYLQYTQMPFCHHDNPRQQHCMHLLLSGNEGLEGRVSETKIR